MTPGPAPEELLKLRAAIHHRALARQAAIDALERLEEAADALADTREERERYRACLQALDHAHRRLVDLSATLRATRS